MTQLVLFFMAVMLDIFMFCMGRFYQAVVYLCKNVPVYSGRKNLFNLLSDVSVILGLGGKKRTKEHIQETIKTLNKINPDFIRIRTFLPKINTPLLEEIKSGEFQILSPHEVLSETYDLIKNLKVTSQITSDHYTNYIGVNGRLPEDRELILQTIQKAFKKDESSFREVYIGNQ